MRATPNFPDPYQQFLCYQLIQIPRGRSGRRACQLLILLAIDPASHLDVDDRLSLPFVDLRCGQISLSEPITPDCRNELAGPLFKVRLWKSVLPALANHHQRTSAILLNVTDQEQGFTNPTIAWY